ncbi:MAG: 30S ribosome-binding factor RbfA [Candidatus Marinimicrobia bacterium]|nr:30S ribosome-binding factor RbfA [Candidatus Neomarinimicrobiota bacterium]
MISRSERLAKEIRHAVAELLIHSAPEDCNEAMLTVSHVELTRDLKEARIFVSVYPPDEALRQRCLKALIEIKGRIRLEIGNKVIMRYVPKIRLFIDDSLDNVENINILLRDI